MAVGLSFFRVVERADGQWVCRWGRHEFDHHAELDDALLHLAEIAGQHRPSEILVHRLDGTVRGAATFDADA